MAPLLLERHRGNRREVDSGKDVLEGGRKGGREEGREGVKMERRREVREDGRRVTVKEVLSVCLVRGREGEER